MSRLMKHVWTTRAAVKHALPDKAMDALERAIGMAERGSSGQIRLVVEAHWPLMDVKHVTPRQRADTICRVLEARFKSGEFEAGLAEGIAVIGELLNQHFSADMGPNEQSDRPVLV